MYDKYEILKILTSKIINVLPDTTDDNVNYYINDILGEYVGYSSMTKDEIMNDAAIQAARIFKKIFDGKQFFIGEDGPYGNAIYSSYIDIINDALSELNQTESELLKVFNDKNADMVVNDYLDLTFMNSI